MAMDFHFWARRCLSVWPSAQGSSLFYRSAGPRPCWGRPPPFGSGHHVIAPTGGRWRLDLVAAETAVTIARPRHRTALNPINACCVASAAEAEASAHAVRI